MKKVLEYLFNSKEIKSRKIQKEVQFSAEASGQFEKLKQKGLTIAVSSY